MSVRTGNDSEETLSRSSEPANISNPCRDSRCARLQRQPARCLGQPDRRQHAIPELLNRRITATDLAAVLRLFLDDTPSVENPTETRAKLRPSPAGAPTRRVCDAVESLRSPSLP